MKKLRLGVVGAGRLGGFHADKAAANPEVELIGVADVSESNRRRVAEKLNIEDFATVAELLPKVDAVVVAAPSILHAEIGREVLNAGKHLISQKPAAPTVELLTEQITLAESKGLKFACAPIHPMRYDLNFAKKLIASGAIGRAYYAKCNVSHGGPEYFQNRVADCSWFFEPGAGALVDMGVHGLQIVTTMFGPAESIACTAICSTPERTIRSGNFNGKKIKADMLPDQYLITLRFPGNRMALVDSGFSQKASKAPQLEIFGDEGTLAFSKGYMANPKPEMYIDCPERGFRGWITPEEWESAPERLNSQCCILRDLVRAIEGDSVPVLSAYHARHVLEIMTKIPEAIESGCTMKLETTF
jgi:predicted dehydrogenase